MFVGGNSLEERVRAKSFALEDVSEISPRTPAALDILLNRKNDVYFLGLGKLDVGFLIPIASDIASGKKATIRIVYGASEEVPLRGLSYPLPAFMLMERFNDGGFEIPELQVIFATHISSILNSLDSERVGFQTKLLSSCLADYVRTFFPQIADKVRFLQDVPLEKDSFIREEMIEITRILRSYLSSEAFEELMSKGNGRARINPYYGAAHLLVHDSDNSEIFEALDGKGDVGMSESIISFGSRQEELFYKIRFELKPHLGDNYNHLPTLQFMTRHRVPPYYMARGGDISLHKAIEEGEIPNFEVAKAAFYDINHLIRESERRGDLDSFLESSRRFM